jgi:hypothetical protein
MRISRRSVLRTIALTSAYTAVTARPAYAAAKLEIKFVGSTVFSRTGDRMVVAHPKMNGHKPTLLVPDFVALQRSPQASAVIDRPGRRGIELEDTFVGRSLPRGKFYGGRLFYPEGEIVISGGSGALDSTDLRHLVPVAYGGGLRDNWKDYAATHLTLSHGVVEADKIDALENMLEHHKFKWIMYDGTSDKGSNFDLTNVVSYSCRGVSELSFRDKDQGQVNLLLLGSEKIAVWLFNNTDLVAGNLYQARHCAAYLTLCKNYSGQPQWPRRVDKKANEGEIGTDSIPKGPDPIYCPPGEI